ncbi:MAG: hypothetical protein GEU86_17955 [Actinophytocola sp.]|nr:hypothetical protein [Actinophytocola sp.]
MGTIVNVVAVVIAITSVIAAAGHTAYLGMLSSAASKRAGGEPVANYVRGRWPIAIGTTAAALVAWLMTGSDAAMIDVLAIALAAGSGVAATRALRSTQARYRIGG